MVFEDRRREIYESWPKYQREVSEYNHALYEKFRIKQETVDAFESYLRDTNNPSLEQYYDNKVKGTYTREVLAALIFLGYASSVCVCIVLCYHHLYLWWDII